MLDDESGMAALRSLGARSVPVVSRGASYVFAQVLQDVVDFLGLDDDTGPKLTPAELAGRYRHVLATAVRLVGQMPDERLDDELPNRPRSWRVLMHHLFQIPTAFMDSEASGEMLTYEQLVGPPPAALRSAADISAFGARVAERFDAWWEANRDSDFTHKVTPYFGETTRHELFERTVWHSTQHVRQVTTLLERAGVTPDRPLDATAIEGLPLTERVWDD